MCGLSTYGIVRVRASTSGAGRDLGIRGEMHARHGEGYDVIQVLYLQGEAGVGN